MPTYQPYSGGAILDAAGQAASVQGTATKLYEDGTFSAMYNYTTLDENNLLYDMDPSFYIFHYQALESEAMAELLETLSTQEAIIICEIYPYTYSLPEESDESIVLYNLGYNGLSDPSITFKGLDDTAIGLDLGGDLGRFDIDLNINEKIGLKNKFGFIGVGFQAQINSAIKTIADEVKNSFISKRKIRQRAKRTKIIVENFSSQETILIAPRINEGVTSGATPTSTMGSSGMSTSTSTAGSSGGGGGY